MLDAESCGKRHLGTWILILHAASQGSRTRCCRFGAGAKGCLSALAPVRKLHWDQLEVRVGFHSNLQAATHNRNLARSRDMTTSYNQIAGQNLERLAALSEGIFAVEMTLLALDLRVPAAETINSGRDCQRALLCIFLAYRSIGFIVLHAPLSDFAANWPAVLTPQASPRSETQCPHLGLGL